MSEKETIKVEETETKEETETNEETESSATTPKEQPLPPEVDAFFKGKNKYKHPYGDWKPVVKEDSVKRKVIGEYLDLPADNWYLPENQPAPIVQAQDDSHVKLIFKEREITGIPSSSSSKTNETPVFKKRKTASNRQLRGSSTKDDQKKNDADAD